MNKLAANKLKMFSIYFLLLFVLPASCMATCHPIIGLFPESNFELSKDSRLPKWFSIPEGYERKNLTVKIYYYAPPPFVRSNFKAILLGPPPEYKKIKRKIGTHHWHPRTLERGLTELPAYVVATIDGIEEIIEHKERGDVFNITDEPIQ